ncbi:MAG TPA: 50S ribosomal protein L23 [Candidatus Paceibacterota bacterium]
MKGDLNKILIKPRITEKATFASESSVYVFEVDPRTNAVAVKKAFSEKYKFSPVKVNIVNIPQKNVVVRGKRGKKAGMKKAYVYLKKGEKIENL